MTILAIESSSFGGGVAILREQEILAYNELNLKFSHAEYLLPNIDHLLEQTGLTIKDFDAFAVSIGPGSFTGLRVGVSTAKAFAYSSGKKIIPVSSLKALAYPHRHQDKALVACREARRNEVYLAIYKGMSHCESAEQSKQSPGTLTILNDEMCIPVQEIDQHLPHDSIWLGDGARKYKDYFKKPGTLLDIEFDFPRATNVALIAKQIAEKEAVHLDDLHINYLKKSAAEERLCH